MVTKLFRYIEWLEQESQFGNFYPLMEKVRIGISGEGTDPPIVKADAVQQIYNIIDSMRPLHGCIFYY